jgi:uncharacterized protein YneR
MGGAKMDRDNLKSILAFFSNNLLLIIGMAIIALSAIITLSLRSEIILLTITAVIVFWYTLETREMRKEIVNQNQINIMPILVLRLDEEKRKFFLENHGNFPAFNIEFSSDIELSNETGERLWINLPIIGSIISKEKKFFPIQVNVMSPKESDKSRELSEDEIDLFVENDLIAWLKDNDLRAVVYFENVLGDPYEVKLGFGGVRGIQIEKPTLLSQR